MRLKALIMGTAFLFSQSAFAQLSPSLLSYLELRWQEMDASMGLWYTSSDNKDDALLGNSQDVILSSYLAMFRGTQNEFYLQRFIQQMDIVLAKRDDIAGFRDYTGNSNPVWSTRKSGYVSDTTKAYGFLVESGNLTYPMADFAQIIINGPTSLQSKVHSSGKTYLQVALLYRQRALETYVYHMRTFSTDTINGLPIGWFNSASDANFLVGIAPGKPYPLNFATSMGRTAVMLWLAYQKTGSFQDTAKRLAGYALLELEYQSNDSYKWRYYPRMSYYPAGYVSIFGNNNADDVYHAAITVEFLSLMAKHQVGVIWDNEIKRLANTFLKNIVADPTMPYQFHFLIDKTHLGGNYDYLNEAGMYLHLARPDNTVASVVYDSLITWLQAHMTLQGASGHRSLAHLIRFYNEQSKGIVYP